MDEHDFSDLIYKKKWYEFCWHFTIFKFDFLIENDWSFGFDICETYPYVPDGEVPLIFIGLGFLYIQFESKRIYKWFYKRKYDILLDI